MKKYAFLLVVFAMLFVGCSNSVRNATSDVIGGEAIVTDKSPTIARNPQPRLIIEQQWGKIEIYRFFDKGQEHYVSVILDKNGNPVSSVITDLMTKQSSSVSTSTSTSSGGSSGK